MIGDDRKTLKVRKIDSYHKLLTLSIEELYEATNKLQRCKETESFRLISQTRFATEFNSLLVESYEYVKKESGYSSMKLAMNNNINISSNGQKLRKIIYIPKKDRVNKIL